MEQQSRECLKTLVGAVVIGRNEGERLKRCLQSIVPLVDRIVYVDSGSTDGSVEYARSINVDVVGLDMSMPFSAGRARNEGFFYLQEEHPDLKYVHFIDGDCELDREWLAFAFAFLEKKKDCAVAAGRRKEKYPQATVYNLLCDIEWNTPIGEAASCGGDFLIRCEAFVQVNGFNPIVVAGEEPDLCYRLRHKGWSIYRLDMDMTLHDAAITKFSQWWKRAVRSGHAYAQGYMLHRKDGLGYYRKPCLQIWLWALFFPVAVVTATLLVSPLFFLFFLAYLAQFVKITLYIHNRLKNLQQSIVYGFFTVIAKFPQLMGQLIFLKRKILKSGYSILEYN
jgi:GT2 family glycosyltransferase